jgi:hypothetical protein
MRPSTIPSFILKVLLALAVVALLGKVTIAPESTDGR